LYIGSTTIEKAVRVLSAYGTSGKKGQNDIVVGNVPE
jgi:hypothetical protein